MDEENTLRSVCEVKQKYALNSALGQLYTLVKPEDIGKEGGSSAQRSVRQVYNYMTCNGGSNAMVGPTLCLSSHAFLFFLLAGLTYGMLCTDIDFWYIWREVKDDGIVLHISDVQKVGTAIDILSASCHFSCLPLKNLHINQNKPYSSPLPCIV